jgi:hypothetical protein
MYVNEVESYIMNKFKAAEVGNNYLSSSSSHFYIKPLETQQVILYMPTNSVYLFLLWPST